jgi:hypothetical protein
MCLDLGRALLHAGQLCLPPSRACRPSQHAPPPNLAKGAAVGLSDRRRRPPVEARPPLPSTKEEDNIAASSAASTTKNRLGRGSPAQRARSRRSIAAVHCRQIGTAPRCPTSLTGTRSSAAGVRRRALRRRRHRTGFARRCTPAAAAEEGGKVGAKAEAVGKEIAPGRPRGRPRSVSAFFSCLLPKTLC